MMFGVISVDSGEITPILMETKSIDHQ